MRLLHTSDWHLGQSLHDFDRTYEHQQFLDWLLALIATEQPDVLLIAGDVFDNANPSASAQHQLYRFLTAARERMPHLSIVIIAGNHDSPGRLEATSPFLELFDAAVVGHVHRRADQSIDVERLVVPLKNRHGVVAAWCLAIPFLRAGDVPRIAGEGEGEHDAYLAGVAALYRQALAVAHSRRQPGQAIVAMGHCHMAHGKLSELSERRIVVGGAEALPTGIFDARIAYVALGHLHLAQAVGGRDHIRYSGSPLPMSFAELDYPHQVVCVELDGEAVAEIRPVRVPRSVELIRVPKTHASIDDVLPLLEALDPGAAAERPAHAHPYLEVRVRLDAPEPGLRARIEAALAGKPVRLARIDPASSPRGDATGSSAMSLGDLERLAPETVFARLCEQRLGGDPGEREALLDALAAAFAELAIEPPDEASA
ncbi:exonuclease SbcCD subunit D C-terminal domain-containing protein [Azoarcus sp. PA01]|nr:exonuclease SbcCD subunit D C-terminal domain-containing protein [Azoarcus sp. PA01]